MTVQDFPSSWSCTDSTSEGDRASATNWTGSSLYLMMSIFSPLSSSTTAATRLPLGPTQAPMGSTFSSWDQTAILVRLPASRAMDWMITVPSAISGTSSSNRRFTRPGWVRDSMICGPFPPRRTSTT